MSDDLFDIFHRRKSRGSHGYDHDRNPPPGYPQVPNSPGSEHQPPYNDSRYRKHDSHYGHPHLVDLLFNKKFRKIAVVLALVGIVILIGVGFLVFPIIGRLLDYVNTNGLKGIMDAGTALVRQLWEGNKG
jgi:hypothetical protein